MGSSPRNRPDDTDPKFPQCLNGKNVYNLVVIPELKVALIDISLRWKEHDQSQGENHLMNGKCLTFCLFACAAIFFAANACAAAVHTNVELQADSHGLQVNAEKNSYLSATAMDGSATQTKTRSLSNRPMGQKKEVNGPTGSSALEPMGNGTVYDANLGVFWLVDANLAGDPQVRKMLGGDKLKINSDGTMDYQTALQWVDLLNKYNGGKGYLDHNKWQLPVTPALDRTCSSHKNDSFGANCIDSALGNLYSVGLGKNFPDSVAPEFSAAVEPFENLQPSLYWTLDTNSGGEVTFSFLSQIQASNTLEYNFMHVLATIPGAIDNKPPASSGVVAYTSGNANGKAVYDAGVKGGRTWILDANLPRSKDFGITGNTTITSKVNKQTLSVPKIDKDGAMLFETANDPDIGWIAALNKNKYAGANSWALPRYDDLKTLASDLQLQAHDRRLVYNGSVGPFQHLQPFFYWACERDQNGDSQSPCDSNLNPPPTGTTPMRWSFNFDNGFQGTSESTKPFYVMVYYPA